MKNTKNLVFCLVIGLFFMLSPVAVFALAGANADEVKVKVYSKQGGGWFRIFTDDTDNKGVLTLKNVVPGWYKMVIDEDDVEDDQGLALKLRMRDRDGKRIKEKTNVNVYVDLSGEKVLAGVYESDKSGWIELEGITSETKYYLDIAEKDGSSLSKKEGRPRIKVKAKIDDSDWFTSFYNRTDENKVLTVKNIIPGKYKFSYKSGDCAETDPFTLYIKMLDEKGEELDEITDVKLYAYVSKVKTLIGTLKTDEDGWVTIPGVMTEMKYKLDI